MPIQKSSSCGFEQLTHNHKSSRQSHNAAARARLRTQQLRHSVPDTEMLRIQQHSIVRRSTTLVNEWACKMLWRQTMHNATRADNSRIAEPNRKDCEVHLPPSGVQFRRKEWRAGRGIAGAWTQARLPDPRMQNVVVKEPRSNLRGDAGPKVDRSRSTATDAAKKNVSGYEREEQLQF